MAQDRHQAAPSVVYGLSHKDFTWAVTGSEFRPAYVVELPLTCGTYVRGWVGMGLMFSTRPTRATLQ